MNQRSSRRSFLKLAGGATLALPFLPSIEKASAGGEFPTRVCFFFVPEGMQPDYWWPTARSETDFDLAASLMPLSGALDKVTILKGIDHSSTLSHEGCYHEIGMMHVLTGGPGAPAIDHAGISTPGGISIDRFLGRHLQGPAPFSSYELGVFSHWNTPVQRELSFDGAGMGRVAQSNPYTVFQELLGGIGSGVDTSELDAAHARRQSILDLVADEARRIRCRASRDDAVKLDAHFTQVRAVEQQLTRLHEQSLAAARAVAIDVPPSWNESSEYESMENYPAVGRLQMDMVSAAFAADTTRVALLQWNTTTSGITFPWLPLHHGGVNHHARGHSQSEYDVTDPIVRGEHIEDIRDISTWYVEQFRYLIDRMSAIPEGDGTLLDHTIVVFLSEMSFSNFHDRTNIPVIVAGCPSRLRLGRYVDLGDEHRSFSDVLTAVCHAAGVDISGWGETAFRGGALGEILV
jgi:hypothetical protein